jgi:hypothetical protein
MRGQLFQPHLKILDVVFLIADENGRGNVHGIDQAEALHAALTYNFSTVPVMFTKPRR